MRTQKEVEDRILRLKILLEEDLGVCIPTAKRMSIQRELNILQWILGGEEYKQDSRTLNLTGNRLGIGKEKQVLDFFANNPDKSFTTKEIMDNIEVSYPSLIDILPELVNAKKIKVIFGIGKRGNPKVYQYNNG